MLVFIQKDIYMKVLPSNNFNIKSDDEIKSCKSRLRFIDSNQRHLKSAERKKILENVVSELGTYFQKKIELPSDPRHYKFTYVKNLIKIDKFSRNFTQTIEKFVNSDNDLREDEVFNYTLHSTLFRLNVRQLQIKNEIKRLGGLLVNFSTIVKNGADFLEDLFKGASFSYETIKTLQKSIFHFVSHRPNIETKNLQLDYLEGLSNSVGLFSILEILNKDSCKDVSLEAKCDKVINILKQALEFAHKIDFIAAVWEKTIEDIECYEKLAEIYPVLIRLEDLKKINSSICSKEELISQLSEKDKQDYEDYMNELIEDKFSNEVLLDNLYRIEAQAIHHMAINESKIYLLGNLGHCIICEISRLEKSYTFTLFNPSYYINKGGHQVITGEGNIKYVKPMKIINLSLSQITSYSFLQTLFYMQGNSEQESTIEEFYNHIKSHLLNSNEDNLIIDQGVASLVPSFGICVTASLNHYFDNIFTEKELEHLEKNKKVFCASKQMIVDDLLESMDEQIVEDSNEPLYEEDIEEDQLSLEQIHMQSDALRLLI